MKWLWLSAVVVALDRLSKLIASARLELHDPLVLTGFFNLTLMHNAGAAFSFLNQAGGWQRWFFVALAVVISVILVLWLRRLSPGQRWLACALALIIGGALGNLWDRLLQGYVVDFIQVHYRHWYWPAFNIADSAISVGAVMLIIDSLRRKNPGDAGGSGI